MVLLETHAEKKAKLDENPVVELKRQAERYAVVCQRKRKPKESSEEGAFNTADAKKRVKGWLESLREAMPLCYHVDKKGMHIDRQCTCLAECDVEVVSDFMIKYCLATPNSRDMMVRSILQDADDLKEEGEPLCYRILSSSGQNSLCLDSFLNLLKIG